MTAEDEAQTQEYLTCEACGGSGVAGTVSREMAMDAGNPGLEGQIVPYHHCGGDGFL